MTQVTVSTDATPDPNAVPAANISGDANKVVVDPNKPAGTPAPEKLILGKFKDQAALEAAYTESQKKITELSTPKPAPTAEQAREAVKNAGLDMTALAKEYNENGGKLTEKTTTELAAKGITREAVNTYIGGLQAQATQMRQEFVKVAGSEEVLKSVLEWSATNGDPAAVKAYNDAIDSGNVLVAKLALQSLGASYNDAVGTDPSLLNGDASTDSGVQPYASSAQVVEAMKDPRYSNDPAYRDVVERRLAKTNVFSIRSSSR